MTKKYVKMEIKNLVIGIVIISSIYYIIDRVRELEERLDKTDEELKETRKEAIEAKSLGTVYKNRLRRHEMSQHGLF